MHLGELVEYGTSEQVFDRPSAQRTRDYISGPSGESRDPPCAGTGRGARTIGTGGGDDSGWERRTCAHGAGAPARRVRVKSGTQREDRKDRKHYTLAQKGLSIAHPSTQVQVLNANVVRGTEAPRRW